MMRRRSEWGVLALVLAWVVVALMPRPARAEDPLDSSFGKGGLSFPGPPYSGAWDLAEDSRGRLIAPIGRVGAFWVGRYLPGGALDTSFGDHGYVGSFEETEGTAYAVAVQPDGKIVAAGFNFGVAFALARYLEDGMPDLSFGFKGRVQTFTGQNGGRAQDVVIQHNGRILAGGYGINVNGNWSGIITAYQPDGRPDNSFGSKGVVRIKARNNVPVEISSLKALPSGKILAAGDLNGRVMLIRLLANGRLDKGFGDGDGRVFTDAGKSKHCECSYATSMALDKRGRMVVAANVTGPAKEPAVLIRYLPNGHLDRTFGDKGKVRTWLGNRFVSKSVAVQLNGRIVLAGTYNVPKTGEARVAVARYLPNGQLDRSFAHSGFFTRDFGVEGVAYATLAQKNGGVVVAGRFSPPSAEFIENKFEIGYNEAEVFLMKFLP